MAVLLFVLLLFAVSFCGFHKTEGFGLDSSLCLRGIMVLLVVFHHLPADENSAVAYFQSACGRYAVALFFFIMSGYGLMTQYCEEGEGSCDARLSGETLQQTIAAVAGGGSRFLSGGGLQCDVEGGGGEFPDG